MGLGYDFLKLMTINKKIRIISTYNKNKILLKQKNLKVLKIDVAKNINKLIFIIRKYKPLNVYYFATPEINLKINTKKIYNNYYNFYVRWPSKLAQCCLMNKSNFFYPSTIFINEKDSSHYSQLKKTFENKALKLNKGYSKIFSLRLPRINTKQNLSLLNETYPNFRDILFKNSEIRKKVFFNS